MSNETKPTPGPYSISGIPGDNHIMAQIGQARQTVCIVTGWRGIKPEEQEANKRLFQAAPDLLAACEALMEFWDSGTPVRPGAEVVNDLKAAIAKAKNQTEL